MLQEENNIPEVELLKAQKTAHDAHAKVAQRLLKALQSTPQHYMDIMKTASEKKPFVVIPMDSNHFFDFTILGANVSKAKQAQSGFKSAKVLKVSNEKRRGFMVMKGFCEEQDDCLWVMQKKKGEYDPRFDLSKVNLPLKYPRGVPLTKDKTSDLKDLLKFVPGEYRAFYNDLFKIQGRRESEVDVQEGPDDPTDDLLDY
ncbi:hypothetical protein O3P69_014575 [Scylla paramamosain]|uniref:Uncharacterized protein n=1 Tax=Scylla paramamosain TaxID=85552 RepID=A0AAW0SCH1_SCYPA